MSYFESNNAFISHVSVIGLKIYVFLCIFMYLYFFKTKNKHYYHLFGKSSAMLTAGFQVSQCHSSKTAFKTNASPVQVWNVMCAWAKLQPPRTPAAGTPAARILAREITYVSRRLMLFVCMFIFGCFHNCCVVATLISLLLKLVER